MYFFFFIFLYLFFLIKFLFIINNTGEKKYKIISLVINLIMFWPIMSTGSLIKNWFGVITFFIIGLCIVLVNLKIIIKTRIYKNFFKFFCNK